MSTYSIIRAWEIAWTEAPGGLQSMGSQSIRHGLVTKQESFLSFRLPVWYLGQEQHHLVHGNCFKSLHLDHALDHLRGLIKSKIWSDSQLSLPFQSQCMFRIEVISLTLLRIG